jgi:hypothetical protein
MEDARLVSLRLEPYRLVFLQSGKCTVGFTFLLLAPIFIFLLFRSGTRRIR